MRCCLVGFELPGSLGKKGNVAYYIALDIRNDGNCMFCKVIFLCTKFWHFLALKSGKEFPFSLVCVGDIDEVAKAEIDFKFLYLKANFHKGLECKF